MFSDEGFMISTLDWFLKAHIHGDCSLLLLPQPRLATLSLDCTEVGIPGPKSEKTAIKARWTAESSCKCPTASAACTASGFYSKDSLGLP